VAARVTQATNDKPQWVPMLEPVEAMTGSQPQQVTADAGYFSEKQVTDAKLKEIDLLVAPDRQKHGRVTPTATGPPPAGSSVAEGMRHKLRTPEGRAVYKMRKAEVEALLAEAARADPSRRGGEADLHHAQLAETLPVRLDAPARMNKLRALAHGITPMTPTLPSTKDSCKPRQSHVKKQIPEALSPTHS